MHLARDNCRACAKQHAAEPYFPWFGPPVAHIPLSGSGKGEGLLEEPLSRGGSY